MVVCQPVTEKSANRWIGHVVCVALQDGSFYVGKVTGVSNGEITLAGIKGNGKLSSRLPSRLQKNEKVKIYGLLGSLFGGGGGMFPSPSFGAGTAREGVAGPAQGSAQGGFLRKVWPGIRIGLGIVQFIWPLVGKFLI